MRSWHTFFVLAGAIAAWLCVGPKIAEAKYPDGIYKVLKAARFHFVDRDDARHAWPEGEIFVGGHQYEIWGFEWQDARANTASYPSHDNILVFEQRPDGLFYLGAYDVHDARVSMEARAMRLIYPPHGVMDAALAEDRIAFDDDGPPAQVRLFGAVHKFVRQNVLFPVGWNAPDHHSGVWKLLIDNGDSWMINSDARIWPAGTIAANGRQYEIWGYAWEETPETKAASTEHAHYRLLVLERKAKGLSLLGEYTVSGMPFHVRGRTVKFDYGKGGAGAGGDTIDFSNGPPGFVLLAGEERKFAPASHNVSAGPY
ncbi:MAG TPA: hypothetical protein VHC39_16380 [Rhizomicrobium sp.]|nr:hypothetical protein [Rhizomicrobium sp.]